MDRTEKIIGYFEGQLSEKERVAFMKEAESDPALRKEILDYQNVRGILSLKDAGTDKETAEFHYALLMEKYNKRMFWRKVRRTAGYVAAACVLFFLGMTVSSLMNHKDTQSQTVAVEQELMVPSGQRARITLPDGSVAWLNAGSTLKYPSVFEGNDRRVQLTGEAFFDVVSNRNKPFIVNAGNLSIKALGTKFNVSNYPKADYFNAILVEGEIDVYSSENKKDKHSLSPNEQIFVENGKFHTEQSFDRDQLLWKDGVYSFKHENIEEIIKKLELYYDVKIIVKNQRLLQYKYTGKFRQRDGVMEILRMIRKIHQFKIEKDEELNQITIS
ncbi:MAG: FecR domain-containing protein [Tannerella sp.]|jgi:ferric-dicitrate binding protein FerR (iron transport regulator)|nr:FecR domain-containing protein [Tannerella sp.]